MLVLGTGLGIGVRHYLNRGVTPELRALEFSDPEADARSAVLRNDLHLIGVYGLGLSVPGVDTDIRDHYSIVPIKGTSDCLQSSEHGRLQLVAYHYAEKYNRIIFDAIQKEETRSR